MPNEAYTLLSQNGLVSVPEDVFMNSVATNPAYADKIYGFFNQNGLTDFDKGTFAANYFTPSPQSKTINIPTVGSTTIDGPVPKKQPKQSVFNEKPGLLTEKPTLAINNVDQESLDEFLFDPAKLSKAGTKTEKRVDAADLFNRDFKKQQEDFESKIFKVDGTPVYPLQDEDTGQWYYMKGADRVVMQSPPTIKAGDIFSVPVNMWGIMAKQVKAKIPSETSGTAVGIRGPVKFVQYTGDKDNPYIAVDRPVQVEETVLPTAFVYGKKKVAPSIPRYPSKEKVEPDFSSKNLGENVGIGKTLNLQGFAQTLGTIANEQGGFDGLVKLDKTIPGIYDEFNKYIESLPESYKQRAEADPKFLRSLLLDAVNNKFGLPKMINTTDVAVLNQAYDISEQYSQKQNAIKAKIQFGLEKIMRDSGKSELFSRFKELNTFFEKNKDLIDAIAWERKTTNKAMTKVDDKYPGYTEQEMQQFKKNRDNGIDTNGEKAQMIDEAITEYNSILEKIRPEMALAKTKLPLLQQQFENNNKEFDKFKTYYASAKNRLNSNFENQESYLESINLVNYGIFKKQNTQDESQSDFEARVMSNGIDTLDVLTSFTNGLLGGLLNLGQTIYAGDLNPLNLSTKAVYSGINQLVKLAGGEDIGDLGTQFEKMNVGLNNNLKMLSPEFLSEMDKAKVKISGRNTMEAFKTTGEMTPLIAALMMGGGPALSEGAGGVVEYMGLRGAGARLAVMSAEQSTARAITFAATYAQMLPRATREAQDLKLTGEAFEVYRHTVSTLEALSESIITPERLVKRGMGSWVMRNIVKGRVVKADAKFVAKDLLRSAMQTFTKDFPMEQFENDINNVLMPIVAYSVNALEGRKAVDENMKLWNENEILTTLGATALMGSVGQARSAYGAVQAIGQKTAYNIRSKGVLPMLIMYNNNPEFAKETLNRLSVIDSETAKVLESTISDFEHAQQGMPDNLTEPQKIGIFAKMQEINSAEQRMNNPSLSPILRKPLEDEVANLKKELAEMVANPELADKTLQAEIEEFKNTVAKAGEIAQQRAEALQDLEDSELTGGQAPQAQAQNVQAESIDESKGNVAKGKVSVTMPFRTQTKQEAAHMNSVKVEEDGPITSETQVAATLMDSGVKDFFEVEVPEQTVELSGIDEEGNKTTIKTSSIKAQSFLKKRNFDLLNILNCTLK